MNALDELIEQARQDDPILAGQAALELVDLRSIVSELMVEYWRVSEPGNYIVCRYCGSSAYRGADIKHRLTCPVHRAKIYLTWPAHEAREEVGP
jgi:hypothetical protein